MQYLPFGNDEFPISAKATYPVVIFDSYNEHHTLIAEKSALEKLDASEQNEKHIVQAAKGEGNVPTPKGNKVEDDTWFSKSTSFFEAPNRCFVYDHDFFEEVIYYADTEDIQFVNYFNKTHKFIKMSTQQLEQIIFTIEMIVKDGVTELPTMDQILFLLDKEAPPYPIIEAVFKHWETRSKLKGSILHLKEYPPDHAGIRQEYIKKLSSNKKLTKSQTSYIKKLHAELDNIQQSRSEALQLLSEQVKQRRQNIVFLREKIRKVRSSSNPKFALLLEPELNDCNDKVDEEPKDLKCANFPIGILPQPPSGPSFLKWVQDQETVL